LHRTHIFYIFVIKNFAEMTTITIKNGQKRFRKTNFNTAEELFIYLKEELNPLKLFLVDEENLSKESLDKIKKSKNNTNRNLTDFQG